MTSQFSETNLVGSLEFCEQCQNCRLNSWMNKNYQMTLQDSCLNEIDVNTLDPVLKQKYIQLKEQIVFKTKIAELEFFKVFYNWNELFLNNLKPDNINDHVPSPIDQPQIELPVSKDHQFDYLTETHQKSQSITNIYEDLLDFNKSQKISQTQFQLEEYFPNYNSFNELKKNMISQQTQTISNFNQIDDENITDFFKSELYKKLKNKQFLIDAQLVSVIQTIFIYNRDNSIQMNEFIINEIKQIQQRIRESDQVNHNTINIMIDQLI